MFLIPKFSTGMAVTRKMASGSSKGFGGKFRHVWNKYVKGGLKELYSLIMEPSRAYILACILILVP